MTIPVFPVLPGLTYPFKRTAEVQGTNLQAMSGRKTWLPNWQWPLYHYELEFSVLRSNAALLEYQTLLGFFNSVKTVPGGYFFLNDPDDNAVVDQLINVGDGSSTVFQPVRTLGGFVEPVLGAQAAGSTFKVGGVSTAFTIDPSTGLVSFGSPPGSSVPITWTGPYYWVCQFEDNELDFSKFMTSFYETKSLKCVTVRF